MTPQRREALRKRLLEIEARYHRLDFLQTDPLDWVHRYENPWDQEGVAVLSALLAFGNAIQIRRSIQTVLDLWSHNGGMTPAAWIRNGDRSVLNGFRHRFISGQALAQVFDLMSRSWELHGSVGAHFLKKMNPTDPHIGFALEHFLAEWMAWVEGSPTRELKFLLSSPRGGSPCKRWCMLLRWMGRRDELDLGLWQSGSTLLGERQGLRPSQLLIPLDTHLIKIVKKLKLSSQATMSWKVVLEVSEKLRELDPQDPIRFDFALCRLGMRKEIESL